VNTDQGRASPEPSQATETKATGSSAATNTGVNASRNSGQNSALS